MPDLNKLKSFMERTQRALQSATDAGDQASVDQYEQFLDRANSVAERAVAGPQGQPGATGKPGSNLPQPPQEAPQLMAPVSKIEADIEGESMPPPGAKKKPDPASSALDSVILEGMKNDTLSSIDKTIAAGNEYSQDSALLRAMRKLERDPELETALEQAKRIQTPDPDYRRMTAVAGGTAFPPGAPVQEAPQAVIDAAAQADSPFLGSLGAALGGKVKQMVNAPPKQETPVDDEYTPVPELINPPSHDIHDEETRPSLPQTVLSKPGAFPPTVPQKPVEEEPKFFSLHRLAQILLTGAPSAVRSYDQEKQGFLNRQYGRERQNQLDKRNAVDNSWRERIQESRAKIESQKAMASLLPYQAREEARVYLQAADNASKRTGDLMRMIPPPPPEDPRWAQYFREEQEALKAVEEINKRVFASLRGGN